MVKVGKYESRRLRSRKPGYNSNNGFGFFFFFFFFFFAGAPFYSSILYKLSTFSQKTVF